MKKMMALSLALASCVALAVAGCGDDDDNTGAAGMSAAGAAGTAGTSAAGAAGTSAAGNDGTGTGPGSTLKCASGKNAYQTYGANFGKVNDAIFANVTAEITANADKNLGSSFQNSQELKNTPDKFKTNLANFLIFAYGGPNNYTGRDMKTAHTGLAITSDQYTYFVTQIVVPAVKAQGVTDADINDCFAPPLLDKDFVASIVGQ